MDELDMDSTSEDMFISLLNETSEAGSVNDADFYNNRYTSSGRTTTEGANSSSSTVTAPPNNRNVISNRHENEFGTNSSFLHNARGLGSGSIGSIQEVDQQILQRRNSIALNCTSASHLNTQPQQQELHTTSNANMNMQLSQQEALLNVFQLNQQISSYNNQQQQSQTSAMIPQATINNTTVRYSNSNNNNNNKRKSDSTTKSIHQSSSKMPRLSSTTTIHLNTNSTNETAGATSTTTSATARSSSRTSSIMPSSLIPQQLKKQKYPELRTNKNDMEAKRANKVSLLIDELRDKMVEGGWHKNSMKSKYETLSSCQDYVKHLVKTTKEKERLVQEARRELEKKENGSEQGSDISGLTSSSSGGERSGDGAATTGRNRNATTTNNKNKKNRKKARRVETSENTNAKNNTNSGSKSPPTALASHVSNILDFEEVFLNSNVPQIIATTAGRIITWNKAFTKLTGISDQELRYLSIFSLVAIDQLARLFDLVGTALGQVKSNDNNNFLRQDRCSITSSNNQNHGSTTSSGETVTTSVSDSNNTNEKQNINGGTISMTTTNTSYSSSNITTSADSYRDDSTNAAVDGRNHEYIKKRRKERAVGRYDSISLECIPFNNPRLKVDPNPLYMTVTLAHDSDPNKRCFHCILSSKKGKSGAISQDALAALFEY